MGGFFGCCQSTSGGGGSSAATLGKRLTYASPSGSVAAAPTGFSSTTGRLITSLPNGSATWISLTAGVDGQLLVIQNADNTNSLTLPQADWGGVGDHFLPPGNKILVYYDSTLALWQVTSP